MIGYISFNNISISCYAICKRNHRIIIGNVAEGIQYDTVCGGAGVVLLVVGIAAFRVAVVDVLVAVASMAQL